MRIEQHQILPVISKKKNMFWYDGQPLEAYEGEPVLAALWANDILICRLSGKYQEARGCYCGIGRCGECRMVVNGIKDVRTCITTVEEGMTVQTQKD